MAITGTGTELDPYVPETCQDLLDLLNCPNNGSYLNEYVELRSDINFATDPDYRDGLSAVIAGGTTKTVSSQSGHMYRINGLRTQYGVINKAQSTRFTFNNIFFSNIVSMGNNPVFATYSAYGTLIFNSCKISALIKTTWAYGVLFDSAGVANAITYNDCSIYIQASMIVSSYTTSQTNKCFSNSKKSNSCIEIHNWQFIGDGNVYHIQYSTNTTYYGDSIMKAAGNSTQNYRFYGCTSIVNAISISFVESNLGYSGTVFNTMGGVSIIDKDILPTGFTLTANANVAYCTTAQMKNEQYLLSIGFLP